MSTTHDSETRGGDRPRSRNGKISLLGSLKPRRRLISSEAITLRETRRSVLYICGDEAWKRAVPSSDSLVDRRHACERELELNRDLAAGVYLGVEPITRDRAGEQLGGSGEIVDWTIRMRYLPAENRLDAVIESGRPAEPALLGLAHKLAAFHERVGEAPFALSPPAVGVRAPASTLTSFRASTANGAAEIGDSNLADAIEEAERRQREFIAYNAPLFAARRRSGRLRECHGEFALEHVFVEGDGSIDVIGRRELAPEKRFDDVCLDVSALSTELAARGRSDLAEHFIAAYANQANDFDLYALIDFYSSLGASRRARFEAECAILASATDSARDHCLARARRYARLALAAGHRPILPPVVVATGGQVASGKSTVARRIASEIGAPIVSTDRTRDFLLGARVGRDRHELDWERAYDADFPERVYGETLRRARVVLDSGRPVVIDGCFRAALQRAGARQLAEDSGHPFLFVEASVPQKTQELRLRLRSRRDGEPDSTWIDIANEMRAQWEDPTELPPEESITIDTSASPDRAIQPVLERLPTWPPGLEG